MDRAALDHDGYLVVDRVLDDAWLARLKRAFDAAPAQENGTQHVRVDAEIPEHEAWRALESHAVVLAAARHVLGSAFHVRDLHGRNPLPGYGQQGLHTDWPNRDEGAPFFVLTALFMLDEFTAENGATRVVPGSHRSTRAIPKELAQPLAHHPHERSIVGAAGSVLLLNGHTWHSGTKNESGNTRRAAQMVIERGARRRGDRSSTAS